MIIGAGSGNDVAAALRAGARHVDAVEIDPRINAIGRRFHPNQPYDDPRVSIHLDDGRSFVRQYRAANTISRCTRWSIRSCCIPDIPACGWRISSSRTRPSRT